jgi:hypothetical protein
MPTFSQNTSEDFTSWKLFKEVSGMQIFSKEIGCHDNQNGIHEKFIVFQFVNTSSETISVTWQKELWYNEKCTTCDRIPNSENTFNLVLATGESSEGSCDKTSPAGLKIFSNFLYTVKGSLLTKFEFKNLEVTFK